MKTTYISLFFIILLIALFFGLYLVDIPAPSSLIQENYNLEIK